MWELDHQESWALKSWCFWTVVLEKTLESPLDCKEIHPVHPKGDQSWISIGRNDAEVETPIQWKELTHWRRSWCWARWKAGGEEDDRGWDGPMASPTWWTGVWASSGGWWSTGNLVCCSPWEKSQTWLSNWNEMNSLYSCHLFLISSASVRSIQFLSFIVLIFTWNVSSVSLIFLKSQIFPFLLLSSISLHWPHRKAILFFLSILWNSALRWIFVSFSPLHFASLLFSAICKASSDNHFPFYSSFSWGWFWSQPPIQCYKPLSIVLHALYLI